MTPLEATKRPNWSFLFKGEIMNKNQFDQTEDILKTLQALSGKLDNLSTNQRIDYLKSLGFSLGYKQEEDDKKELEHS